LSSKDKDLILGEPIPKVHDFDEDEGITNARTLNLQTLQEALETSAHQHIEEALQMVEREEAQEQTDDESQDEQDQTNVDI
jgi:DNA-binding phage protein